MGLKETLNNDIKSAMRAKDQARLRTLRAIKSAIMLTETAEGRNGEPLTEEEDLKLLTKQAKQRRDSRDQYLANGREDLAATESEELAVIEGYLPKALSEEEVEGIVQEIIAATGANSMKDMGKVMGQATKRMAGQADGKLISTLVRKHLA
ncbi:MAG: GatB/YqeY domain-containing protein [Bacteroidota bacterium]